MRHGIDVCPSCGAAWLTSTLYQRAGCANADCELRMRLPHEPADGEEWMPAGWCGGCEQCNTMSPPVICVACTYEPGRPLMSALFPAAPPDMPEQPVLWADCPKNPDSRDVGTSDGVITLANGDTLTFDYKTTISGD